MSNPVSALQSERPACATTGTILVVDDDDMVRTAVMRILRYAGFSAEGCSSGNDALRKVAAGDVDAIISDIAMPNMDGIEFLRRVRQIDLDLPVVLMTGGPSIESAIRAVEYGALKYLVKPFDSDELIGTATRAVQLSALAQTKREALSMLGAVTGEASGRAGLEASFEHALSSLWIAFQPVVRASDYSVFGHEALLRTREPTLPHPGAVIDAAERLSLVHRLGRTVRARALAQVATRAAETHSCVFLNLHPQDLLDRQLLEWSSPVDHRRIVLEVTERASLDSVPNVRDSIRALRSAGFRIAIDDLGAGYAGLASFVDLEPDFVKLDMSLIRGVDRNTIKQRLIRSMTSVCKDMGLLVVAEGIETREEHETIVELGCDLLQGYRFGRPMAELV